MAKFPKGFAFFIGLLLLLLLAGYLWLADIVPKQSPSPLREEMRNTATQPSPIDDVSSWTEYRDPKLSFTLRYPKSWQISSVDQTPYEVSFNDHERGYELTIKAYANASLTNVLGMLKKESATGLFPPLEVATLALADGSEAPAFVDYTSPHGDATMSSAAIERDGTVYVFNLKRPMNAPDHAGLFHLWLRSFSV